MAMLDQNFTVVGLGRSGAAAARVLVAAGANVRLHDDVAATTLEALAYELGSVPAFLGQVPPPREGETYVVAPGVVADSDSYFRIVDSGAPIIDEIEVFWRLIDERGLTGSVRTVGVTGTNGKTSTVMLVAHLLSTGGHDVVVGGNIGTPLCSTLDRVGPATVLVLELSEIHLLHRLSLRLDCAVVTNLDEDHIVGLPVFGGSIERYHAAKLRILDLVRPGGPVVYSLDCPRSVAAMATKAGVADHRLVPTTVEPLHTAGATWHFDGRAYLSPEAMAIDGHHLSDRNADDDRVLVGPHTHANALMAIAVGVEEFSLGEDAIKGGLDGFRFPLHRVAVVDSDEDHPVAFIDDSKATNPPAAIAGLRLTRGSYPQVPIVWIGGGQADIAPRDSMLAEVRATASGCVLLGESAERLRDALAPHLPCVVADCMIDAVRSAAAMAGDSGVVLLGPGYKSFDMYRSYAHRGDEFVAAVRTLRGESDVKVSQTGGDRGLRD